MSKNETVSPLDAIRTTKARKGTCEKRGCENTAEAVVEIRVREMRGDRKQITSESRSFCAADAVEAFKRTDVALKKG